jgi:LCP family protein required for cell wall assembly
MQEGATPAEAAGTGEETPQTVPSEEVDQGAVVPAEKISLPGRDPIWARLLIVFGTLLAVVASGSIAGQRLLASRYEHAVHRETLIAPDARDTEEPVSTLTGPLNYLLIGSDARIGEPEKGQRSDTTIIMHIPATLDRVYLVSIPRDLRVDIPAFAPNQFPGQHGVKINGAFQAGGGGRGGAQLVSSTLKQLTGVTFDGAAIIDFNGFIKVVDMLGGVDMCVDERTESHQIGFDKNGKMTPPWVGINGDIRVYGVTPKVYEVGCQHLQGWEALDYVRQRYSLPDGDFGRERHQQQFLRAILDRAAQQHVVTDPIKIDSLIRAVGQSLTLDTGGLPLDELVYGLRNIRPGAIVGVRLPSYPQDINGFAYVLAYPEADSLYAAIRDDTLDQWVVANPSWVNAL